MTDQQASRQSDRFEVRATAERPIAPIAPIAGTTTNAEDMPLHATACALAGSGAFAFSALRLNPV